jgi:predicted transcriptional regulator
MRSLRDANRRPTHPGELLREDVLPALGMTQTALAERLSVSRLTVSELLHGKRRSRPTWRSGSRDCSARHLRAGSICSRRLTCGKLSAKTKSTATSSR